MAELRGSKRAPRETASSAFARSALIRDLKTYPAAPMSNALRTKSAFSWTDKKTILAPHPVLIRRLATWMPVMSPREISSRMMSGFKFGASARTDAPRENVPTMEKSSCNISSSVCNIAGLSSTSTNRLPGKTVLRGTPIFRHNARRRFSYLAYRHNGILHTSETACYTPKKLQPWIIGNFLDGPAIGKGARNRSLVVDYPTKFLRLPRSVSHCGSMSYV